MIRDNSMTLSLAGDVTLAALATAINGWSDLVSALAEDVAGGASIEWAVEDLRPGSATATVIGASPVESAVPRVIRAYGVVGDAMEKGKVIPYSDRVSRSARAIVAILDGAVTSVSFLTAESESVVVTRSPEPGPRPAIHLSLGTITGTVDTLSRRRGLKFTLYDDLFDRAIACYLASGQEDMIRDAWGRHVAVTGLISREPFRGMPISLREIQRIRQVPEPPPGGFRDAMGVLPVTCEADRADLVIRRMRDAQ